MATENVMVRGKASWLMGVLQKALLRKSEGKVGLLEEVLFHVRPGEMAFAAFDPGHTTRVAGTFKGDIKTTTGKETVMPLDVRLMTRLKSFPPDTDVVLTYDGEFLVVEGGERTSRLAALDPEQVANLDKKLDRFPRDPQGNPVLQNGVVLATSFTVPAKVMTEGMETAELAAGTGVRITVKNGEVTFHAANDDNEKESETLRVSVPTKGSDATTLYSPDIGISDFTGVVGEAEVAVHMGTDNPIFLKASGEGWTLDACFAPRIVKEEEPAQPPEAVRKREARKGGKKEEKATQAEPAPPPSK